MMKMEEDELSEGQSKPKLWLQILSLLFGFGSWIAITGLWVELPLLIDRLPEGWALGANLTVVIQAANIGPILYWVARRKNWCSEVTANHIQFFLGLMGCVFLVFLWDRTIVISGGKSISIVLYVCGFMLSLVDCTSSTTFLPFMGRFANHYMTPYLVGEGLSGFIPSIVALLQGVGEVELQCPHEWNNSTKTKVVISEPKFSMEVFFLSLVGTLLISWMAFIALWLLPAAKKHQIKQRKYKEHHQLAGRRNTNNLVHFNPRYSLTGNPHVDHRATAEDEKDQFLGKRKGHLNWRDEKYRHAMYIMTWSCFLTFGVLPAMQSYSALPYGEWALHYSVIANNIAFPVGCLIAMICEVRSRHLINVIILIGSLIALYIAQVAVLSPNAPLLSELPKTGGHIMIFSWFTFTFLMSYGKTMVTLDLKDLDADEGLFWIGMATQLGSFVGAILMFFVVNYVQLFSERDC